eukprot:scaffold117577_cov20-Attheya_sp.AAC.1
MNADDEEEVYSNDEKDDVANALDVSSDDDSAPKAEKKKHRHVSPRRPDKVTTKDTFSVSSTSDSDSDNRSNKKPLAKREDDKKPPAK